MAKNYQNPSNTNQNIIFGIIAGTIVGALAAAALNSNKGKKIKEDLYSAYGNATKKFSDAAHSISEHSHEFNDKYLRNNPYKGSEHLNLTIGAIAGGILGISAIAFLNSSSAKGLKGQIIHSFECLSNKAHDLEDYAHCAAEKLEGNVSCWVQKVDKLLNMFTEKQNDSSQRNSSFTQQPIDKILDWAVVAAQVFQSFKK